MIMNKKKNKHYSFNQNNLVGYVMLSPWLLGLFVFTLFTLLSSLFYSFTNFNLLSPPVWVGIKNFEDVFADDRFYQSMKVTFTYVFVSVPLKLIFALLVALLFNMKH